MKFGLLPIRRTTVICFGLVAFLSGLGLARLFAIGGSLVVLGCLVLLVTIRKQNIVSLLSLVLLCAALGCWRGSVYMQKLGAYKDLEKQPVVVTGIADNDAVYADKSQLSFDLAHVQVVDPIDQSLVGKLSIKGFGAPMVFKGDLVQVEGKLFPTRGSKQASIGFADIAVLRRGLSTVDTVRRKFTSGLVSVLPEPLGSFGLGLLIGQRSTLSKSFTNELSAVGLTHIVAVSGYNLTIIILATRRLLSKRSKYQASVLTVCLTGLFLLFAGTSASIVRAAIVSMLSLAAWYYGRTFKPLLLILLAAVLTAGWNPLYIWSDIGWYLSMLAFFGILIIAPLATKRYCRKKPKTLTYVFIETTAAQLATLPLIMYIFGRLSLISLLANLLVVPLLPLAMLLSFTAAIAGMFMSQVAGWLSWPARLLLEYLVDVIHLLSRSPHAVVAQKISATQMIILYGFTVVFIGVLWRSGQKKGTITEKV